MPQPVNFEEQLKLLVELQGLDTHILRIERDIGSIPEELKKIEDAYKAKSAGLKKAEDDLKTLLLKKKEKEIDLETKETAIKKSQSQMYQVKTNKEYTAMETEISRMKADDSLIEEEIIKILDRIDEQNKVIAKEKEAFKAEEALFDSEKMKKAQETKKLEAEAAGFKAQRAELTAKVDKSVLAKYERLLSNRDGLAVVPIRKDSCQGCFRVVPPQVINEVQLKQSLVICDNCTRILYSDET
jgi:uncharacterized protein